MDTQQALILEEVQRPLVLGRRPIPEPNGNQVLVRIIAAGINPHDQKGRDRGLLVEKYLPHAILANDISGIVEKIGPDVQRFSVGDRIVGQSNILSGGPDQAGLQQFCILDANFAAPIPHHISFDQAATFPVNAIASFIALFSSSGLGLAPKFLGHDLDYVNEAIVIIGGNSNSGKFALQFSRLADFGKIIATAKVRSDGGQSLRDLGATHVIDREAADVEDQIRAMVGDDLLYAFDAVNGGVSHRLALSLLSTTKKGSLATLVRGEADPAIAATKTAGFKKTKVLGVSDLHQELAAKFWRELPGWIENGELRPLDFEVIDGLDAMKVNNLLDDYRDGRAVTKTHVHPHHRDSILE
ncbi:zinc-binding alcohol dehydrogenase family protein [Aspergillus novofumigatus IBT 16806]|uniref:GroES-like protein n=1 Tax=Aspergillus novofumigatus (strain IBT 16806) TaxID=1392255 RepID=A0A2I1CJ95_ASPN1|nr:GroES-like protein [Aspergillus novofumigatus IBT 16806]PKX97703.1 GroES-like protein [Aspergillus novofumigatus IBT 16806]